MERRWVTQIICILAIFSLVSLSFHVHVTSSYHSTKAEESIPAIRILNVQSYPKQGGFWTVSFLVEGIADLSISAVEGTTWCDQKYIDCDLLFTSLENKTHTFDTIWENNSVIIKNFSSSTVVREISEVFTLGKHVLKFTFGDYAVYAYNDASNWWDSQWGYRKKITINKSQIYGALENFPILINISDNDLKQKAESTAKDIAFISFEDNTTQFDHEIENYMQGNLTTWVKIPSLTSTKNTTFWMYYNNSECSNQENPTAVWDSNYIMVQHLNETDIDGGLGDITDSTSYSNHGTTVNMNTDDQVIGKINGSFDFDGDNDYVEGSFSSTPITNEFTLSDWISVSALNDQYNHFSLGLTGGTRVVPYIDGSNNINCYFGNDTENTILPSDVFINSVDTWYYITCTYNATHLKIYVNGQLKNTTTVSHSFTDNDFVIGSDISKLSFFHYGKIDEIQISDNARNHSWIKTSFNTVQNQSEFLNLGSEESAAPDVNTPYPSNGNEFLPKIPSYFEITVFDPNPELLNITWRTNQSGVWETINETNGSGNGVPDGTYQVTNTTWVTVFDKIYWWSVNVTDGLHWTNKTYSFAIHQFDPIINSFNLQNISGSKINNQTGNLQVGGEYVFSINITEKNGWNDIDYVNITSWYDFGDETSIYNQTSGGNYNMFLQYKNVSGIGQYTMIWPDDESNLNILNCSETKVNETTRIINLSFIPGNQTRYATSNETWTITENIFDDLYSWNVNCTITDNLSNVHFYTTEYGVDYYSALKAPDLIEITGAPGMIEQSTVFSIDFISNADYTMKIYFDENLTQVDGPDIIGIGGNLSVLQNADEDDDLLVNTTFSGLSEQNAITILNDRSAPSDGSFQSVNVQFELSIPFGTWGTYFTKIIKKINRL